MAFFWLWKKERAACAGRFCRKNGIGQGGGRPSRRARRAGWIKGADEEKKGIFSRLFQGLSKTRANVAGRVEELVEATETIDEDFYEDLVDILIMSDMGVKTSDRVITELKERVKQQRITDARRAREVLKEILKETMNRPRKPLQWPMVMLVVGVNGVGKTTTIGKLAMRFKDARHSVVLAAADTFRAAAADQLEIWAQRAQVPLVRHAEGADPGGRGV